MTRSIVAVLVIITVTMEAVAFLVVIVLDGGGIAASTSAGIAVRISTWIYIQQCWAHIHT